MSARSLAPSNARSPYDSDEENERVTNERTTYSRLRIQLASSSGERELREYRAAAAFPPLLPPLFRE